MWVGLQISEEKICIFGKKLVGPENDVEKKCNLWKKFVGGYRITAGTNFRHTFRKYLPDPPPCGLANFFHGALRRNFDLFWKKYIMTGSFFAILHACIAEKLEKSSKN